MRLVALLSFIALPIVLSAQHVPVINPSRGMIAPQGAYRYGNILFPGGINPGNSHASRLGGTVAGVPYTGVGPGGGYPGGGYPGGGYPGGGYPRGGRPRTVVVPYAVPVYAGGYYAPEPQASNVTVVVPQQQVPQVIINNSYGGQQEPARTSIREYSGDDAAEPSVKVYEGANATPQRSVAPSGRSIMDEQATIYLVALKDGTVRQAIGYWVQGDTLHYVTPNSTINHVSAAMLDRERSVQLNAERNLEFELNFKPGK